jgi:hypothetical protein
MTSNETYTVSLDHLVGHSKCPPHNLNAVRLQRLNKPLRSLERSLWRRVVVVERCNLRHWCRQGRQQAGRRWPKVHMYYPRNTCVNRTQLFQKRLVSVRGLEFLMVRFTVPVCRVGRLSVTQILGLHQRHATAAELTQEELQHLNILVRLPEPQFLEARLAHYDVAAFLQRLCRRTIWVLDVNPSLK